MKPLDITNITTHGHLPQSYYNAINDIGAFDIVLVGNGTTFKDIVSGTTGIGTNTTASNTQSNRFTDGIDFDGSTAYAVTSGVFSGTIPSAMTFSAWLAFDNWASGATEYIARFQVDSNNDYRFFKFSSNALFLYHYQAGTLRQTFYSVAGLTGINHVGFTMSASNIHIYVNGVSVATTTTSAAPTGTLTVSAIGSARPVRSVALCTMSALIPQRHYLQQPC